MPTTNDDHHHERYSPPGFVPLEVRAPGTATPPATEAGGVRHERRGTLRIYLGAAPGVGKTYAMLREAHRLRDVGRDVVVGFVETHGRAETAAQVGDLEVVPRTAIDYRGVRVEEMDTDAILARKPEIAIVDELAHTNVPGSAREKRWEDVDVLRDAG
ncbi:MAG: histidine kinase, partial [Thermomicrobiales bacterium]